MSDPLVSFIIPTFNRAAFLPATLASVLAEDYATREIVIVDDGSTDDTADVCARYPVRYFQREQQGVSAARNFGVTQCSGELLFFLDSDDLCPPGTLRHRVEQWQSAPELAHIHGRVRRFREDEPGEIAFLDTEETAFHYLSLGAGIMVRRAFEAVGGFDETIRMSEDIELWMRMRERGWTQKLIPEICLWHRRHAENATRDLAKTDHGFLSVLRETMRRRQQERSAS